MHQQRLIELIGNFDKTRVLVVGDIYLDDYVYGAMTGISLEAPVPIFEIHERRHNPGAAGNVACNMAALGARVVMVGVVGADANAEILRREFAARGVDASGLVIDPARPTNVYGKLCAGSYNAPVQEVLRTDTPTPPFITGAVEDQLIEMISALAPDLDAIAVVDQVCSVATDRVLKAVTECAAKHGLLTVGDSRERAGALKDFDVVVPNDREAGKGVGIDVVDDQTFLAAGQALLSICRNAVVTRGPRGITVFAADGSVTDVPIAPVDAIDVTGAGDTVTASVTVSLAAGANLVEAAEMGNRAAGIAVQQAGVVTVPREALLPHRPGEGTLPKVKCLDELKEIVARKQREGKKVVWTNGVFDILHVGHISYLLKAARLGDVLVVGLNSDASVQQNKGPSRPIVPEANRVLVLAALECVDYVTVFGDKTTVPILEALKPDVYVKGGDYTIDTIVQEERHVVEGYGGKIAIIPGVEGQSTTAIIDRILQDTAGDPA